jgi:phosphatidylglycerophosphatase C
MKKSIALFDFDGTISTIDSVTYFYKFLYKCNLHYFINNYILCSLHILLYRIRLISYLPLKEYRLDVHTSRFNDVELKMLATEFYSKYFSGILNPKALERIQWHKNQGHDVWVISASYDFLLNDWSAENGIKLIANRTVKKKYKRYIDGKDVNFEGKLEYLKLHVNLDVYSEVYAYGDSEGDNALLSVAHFKYYKPFRN